eukprot:gene6220-6936_t
MAALQWLSAAAFLYVEIFLGILLCLPFISNARWRTIFNSRIAGSLKAKGNYLFTVSVIIMIFLFFDSVFQVRRYSKVDGASQLDLKNNPHAEVAAHMKLFRAQRNCYITGFSLIMLPFLRRLATLISAQAALEASNTAVMKQAQGATDQCKRLLDENEELRKGEKKASSTAAVENEDVTDKLKTEIKEQKDELEEKEKELHRMKKDLEGMKAQTEGLHKEYDRILDENERLQKKLRIQGVEEEESKKDN